jgi:hypothetical protein
MTDGVHTARRETTTLLVRAETIRVPQAQAVPAILQGTPGVPPPRVPLVLPRPNTSAAAAHRARVPDSLYVYDKISGSEKTRRGSGLEVCARDCQVLGR